MLTTYQKNKPDIKLTNVLAKPFYNVFRDIQDRKHVHYWLSGGRGSLKSSSWSIFVIFGMMEDSKRGIYSNAVALRKVAKYLKDSVFQQLEWAIDILGVSHLWHSKVSPMSITYIPTGQTILFRGADQPKKIKSTKFKKGYCKYIVYEEVDEFFGMEEIRVINQSLMRGGNEFINFYSYNPPKTVSNWVNMESSIKRPDKYLHHSSYLNVPREWLGEQFLIEAEHLRKTNLVAYNHEYGGLVTGTGGEIFPNVMIRKITDDEIKQFDHIKRGLDWGYASDPYAYVVCNYDKTRRKLYIFYEEYKTQATNRIIAQDIKKENLFNSFVVCDSAEPKSIAELKEYGIRAIAAKKGQGSVETGIKFLQDMEEIIIDPDRCPNAAREFSTYELEKDKNGNWKAEYPDKNNHTIDAVRYLLENEINSKIKWLK